MLVYCHGHILVKFLKINCTNERMCPLGKTEKTCNSPFYAQLLLSIMDTASSDMILRLAKPALFFQMEVFFLTHSYKLLEPRA